MILRKGDNLLYCSLSYAPLLTIISFDRFFHTVGIKTYAILLTYVIYILVTYIHLLIF